MPRNTEHIGPIPRSNSFGQDSRFYALIDTAQKEGLHRMLLNSGASCRSLFDGYPEESLPEIAPWLVSLPLPNERNPIQSPIERLAKINPMVSWLSSSLAIDDLAEHLRQFHIVEIPGGQRMLLRYYDTRILPVWLAVLTPEQRGWFRRGVDHWQYHDRFGETQGLQLDPVAPMPALPKHLMLDQAQLDRLIAAGDTDRLLMQLKQIIPDQIRQVDYKSCYLFLDGEVQQYKRARIEGMKAWLELAMLALYTGGEYSLHPTIQELFRATQKNEASIQAAIDALPEAVWAMGAPLWHLHPELQTLKGVSR